MIWLTRRSIYSIDALRRQGTYQKANKKTQYKAIFCFRGTHNFLTTGNGSRKMRKSVVMLRPEWLQ